MGWLYHRNYVGPDRRRDRFEVRFIERRKRATNAQTLATLRDTLGEIFARGLKWVDAFSYFGPDRRSGAFSHFIFERRRKDTANTPPPLQSALRQLRVRVLGTENEEERRVLQERLTATAILAEAQRQPDVANLLIELAHQIETARDGDPWTDALQSGLLSAEAMFEAARAAES